jgi:hypothetical protein
MSSLLGFPVINSVMAAVKAYTSSVDDAGMHGGDDLDALFKAQYKSIQTRYLYKPNRIKPVKVPYSSLSMLQELLDRNILVLNAAAFDCYLYNNGKEWFGTRELITTLLSGEDNLARLLIEYTVLTVKRWHEANPQAFWAGPIPDSKIAWRRLLAVLGPYRHALMGTTLARDADEGKSSRLIIANDFDEDNQGDLIGDWAMSCSDFPHILAQIVDSVESGIIDPAIASPELVDEALAP